MNERIKELAVQANDYADGYWDGDTPAWFQFYNEKFVELIVRECAQLASEETSLPYNSYSEKIKKHFGVEH